METVRAETLAPHFEGAAPPGDAPAAGRGEPSGADRAGRRELARTVAGSLVPARPPSLQQHMRPCTPQEAKAAELLVLGKSQAQAWREAYGHEDEPKTNTQWVKSCEVFARPWVIERVRELRAEAMLAHAVDVQAIIARDLRIIEASEHAHLLSRYVYRCCRHCHGVGFEFQWADVLEYAQALDVATAKNDERKQRQQRELPLPTDAGGYGFDPERDPNPMCPRCEGVGVGRAIMGDTRELGPAAPLFKGVKVTANGVEIQLHDVDKAIDRVLKVTGALGDDAASVARGAAAGAAAGASAGARMAAIAAAEAAPNLTTDQLQRLYLQVIGG